MNANFTHSCLKLSQEAICVSFLNKLVEITFVCWLFVLSFVSRATITRLSLCVSVDMKA